MLDNPTNRTTIEGIFTLLGNDSNWRVTSKNDPRYNCIAWAAVRSNVWWSPSEKRLPGVEWPFNLPPNFEPSTLVKLYEHLGYEICESDSCENGFQKVAVYTKTENGKAIWTHAARQLRSGMWTSKLGQAWDIEHSSPDTICNVDYGIVHAIMKRENPIFVF